MWACTASLQEQCSDSGHKLIKKSGAALIAVYKYKEEAVCCIGHFNFLVSSWLFLLCSHTLWLVVLMPSRRIEHILSEHNASLGGHAVQTPCADAETLPLIALVIVMILATCVTNPFVCLGGSRT